MYEERGFENAVNVPFDVVIRMIETGLDNAISSGEFAVYDDEGHTFLFTIEQRIRLATVTDQSHRYGWQIPDIEFEATTEEGYVELHKAVPGWRGRPVFTRVATLYSKSEGEKPNPVPAKCVDVKEYSAYLALDKLLGLGIVNWDDSEDGE